MLRARLLSGSLLGVLALGATFARADTDAPTPRGETPTDHWAGKPVMTAAHVNGMIPARLHNAPKLGEKAPWFALTDAFGGRSVSLRELHRYKPVVLFFASYSCHITHDVSADIVRLSERFGDRARFAMIYIREAHPLGGFPPIEEGDAYVVPVATTFAERALAAVRLAKERRIRFPVLVDRMDDATAVRWGAWPVRLFVIDRGGRVVYSGQQGPWFFRHTRAFEDNLPGVPERFGNLKGYSMESLEEFLEQMKPSAEAEEAAESTHHHQDPRIPSTRDP